MYDFRVSNSESRAKTAEHPTYFILALELGAPKRSERLLVLPPGRSVATSGADISDLFGCSPELMQITVNQLQERGYNGIVITNTTPKMPYRDAHEAHIKIDTLQIHTISHKPTQ